MKGEIHFEQQTDTAGALIDSYLVTQTVGLVDLTTQVSGLTVGLGSYLNRAQLQSVVDNNPGYYISIELAATFKRQTTQ